MLGLKQRVHQVAELPPAGPPGGELESWRQRNEAAAADH
jgi:hypothetical protein